MKTVVALFDHITEAQAAVQALVNDGFDRSRISLVAGDREGLYSSSLDQTVDEGDATATGAATGAVLGGIGGVLVGLGALAIPGIGPVIAAGPLIAGLIGAGVGATVGGLVGALVDAGLPEEHAGYYAEGVRRGGSLVSVESADADVNRVIAILDRHDPVDINERVSTWRASGWRGFDADTEPNPYRDPAQSNRESRISPTLNPASETLHTAGGSSTRINTWSSPSEHGVIGGPKLGEEAKGGSSYDWNNPTTSSTTMRNPQDVRSYDPSFRSHYQSYFGTTGVAYERYEPAYRYGYTLATDPHYQGRDWNEIESDARLYWNTHHVDSPWEQFKDAVRHGWQEVKQAVRG